MLSSNFVNLRSNSQVGLMLKEVNPKMVGCAVGNEVSCKELTENKDDGV